MRAGGFHVVLVTAPDLRIARSLAKAALKQHLIACANILPRLESHYRWKGKLERGSEVLLMFKTTSARLKPLEALVLAHHPYDTPEFLVLPLSAGNRRYLEWLQDACATAGRSQRRR